MSFLPRSALARVGAGLLLALVAGCAATGPASSSSLPASSPRASSAASPRAVATLDPSLEPLRTRFDLGASRPRLVVLASPT